MKIFQHAARLKEFYRAHLYLPHLDYAIDISLYLFYHICIHLPTLQTPIYVYSQ